MVTETNLLTLSDYGALDEPEDTYVTELVGGVVVREPRPGRPHGRLQVRLAYHLERWASAHDADVTVESGYVLSEEPATVRGPDVAIVLDPRSARQDSHGWVRGAPDLVVEILSPSDSSTSVHRPDGSANLLREAETLDGEEVLAGVSLRPSELF